jgi:hypothetical protein
MIEVTLAVATINPNGNSFNALTIEVYTYICYCENLFTLYTDHKLTIQIIWMVIIQIKLLRRNTLTICACEN